VVKGLTVSQRTPPHKKKSKKKSHKTHARARFRSRLNMKYGTRERKDIIAMLKNGEYLACEKQEAYRDTYKALIEFKERRIWVVWNEERNKIVTVWRDDD
jgi:hypothetical protein